MNRSLHVNHGQKKQANYITTTLKVIIEFLSILECRHYMKLHYFYHNFGLVTLQDSVNE